LADADVLEVGLPPLPADFGELRWTLCEEEIARYREGARRASRAMEAACHEVRPGRPSTRSRQSSMSAYSARGARFTLYSSPPDDRIDRFRHPIPTDRKLARRAMLVVGSEFGGLLTSLTRFVSFARTVR
jgi:Xaa-Pro aminopeptidase